MSGTFVVSSEETASDTRASPPVEVVLLDLYETLVRPDWAVLDDGRAALARRVGADAAFLEAEWRRTQEQRFRGAFGGLEDEIAAVLGASGLSVDGALLLELAALERATWSRGLRLYDDTLPELRRLRRSGRRLAIVSNCGWQTASAVEELRIGDEVDTVVLSCQVGYLKPDPAILRVALDRLGAPPATAILVDDRVENLDAARAIGLRTALIARDAAPDPAADHPSILSMAGLWPLLG